MVNASTTDSVAKLQANAAAAAAKKADAPKPAPVRAPWGPGPVHEGSWQGGSCRVRESLHPHVHAWRPAGSACIAHHPGACLA